MKNCSHCQTQNVDTATFCKKCGNEIKDIRHTTVDAKTADVRVDTRPFHMRYPEYNLIPYSEHPANFVFNKPDYIEREYLPHDQDQFLWIVKDGKFGITTYRYEDHWYGDEVHTNRIIKCEYDRIDKADGCFICHKGSQITYIDLKYIKIMDIQCPNPECRADNPAGAKFCRKCGTAFTPANRFKQMFSSAIAKLFAKSPTAGASTFTLDTFSNITFQPVSVVKIRFVNRFVVFLFIMFAVFWFISISGLMGNLIPAFSWYLYERVYLPIKYIIELGCLVVAGLCALFILKWLFKKLRYKLNADYIEGSFINYEIVRIARKSRMGLFDKSKNKVLLPSYYSNIEKFDNQHLLISKGNKKGLYSLTYRKIIVPVKYDSISQFVNSVTSAAIQGTEHHYDVKGNELR